MVSRGFAGRFKRRVVLFVAQLGVAIAIVSLIAVVKIKADAATQPGTATGEYVYAANIDETVHYITVTQDQLLTYAVPGIWAGMLTAFVFAIAYSSQRRRESERGTEQ